MLVLAEDTIQCTAPQASDDRMTTRFEGSGSRVHGERSILRQSDTDSRDEMIGPIVARGLFRVNATRSQEVQHVPGGSAEAGRPGKRWT